MEIKEKRHQTEEREWLTEDLRIKIKKKSDDKCVWCGKKVFFGYGATVDHFIPLKKGGTNDLVNLVLMCKDCNEKKKSYVTPVSLCASHLNPEYAIELEAHVDDYIHQFDYVSRGNLMAFDMYELFLIPQVLYDRKPKKNKKNPIQYKQSPYLLKRAYPEDIDRLYGYFVKYLKKYNNLGSEEAALENIKFWMRFGAIYFIEVRDEIYTMSSMIVNKHGFISINLFSYYSNMLAVTLAKGVIKCLTENISTEHNLSYSPVSINIVEEDSLRYKVVASNSTAVFNGFRCCLFKIGNDRFAGSEEEGEKNVQDFLNNFKDIENEINEYFYFNHLENITWMADEVLERKPTS